MAVAASAALAVAAAMLAVVARAAIGNAITKRNARLTDRQNHIVLV
jgi:hypothetical protein